MTVLSCCNCSRVTKLSKPRIDKPSHDILDTSNDFWVYSATARTIIILLFTSGQDARTTPAQFRRLAAFFWRPKSLSRFWCRIFRNCATPDWLNYKLYIIHYLAQHLLRFCSIDVHSANATSCIIALLIGPTAARLKHKLSATRSSPILYKGETGKQL